MGDIPVEALLPFQTLLDPPQQAEGSLDPLGLYSIADALGVRLAPGVRERQSRPRYLTLALVGMSICGNELNDRAREARTPAWLVYEWLVVTSLVLQLKDAQGLRGVPGNTKVRNTLEAGDVLCERTYLKSPAVFGFHGIYRVLGLKAGLFDAEGNPLALGQRILAEWQRDSGMIGFADGCGPGGNFRRLVAKAVSKGLDDDCVRVPSKELSELIATHLNPQHVGKHERSALWSALKHNDAFRRECAERLCSDEGQAAWIEAEGSERTYHMWLRSGASLPLTQLLLTIDAFEQLARLLTDAFDECRWRMTNERKAVDFAWVANGPAVTQAAKHCGTAFANARAKLGELDPALQIKADRSFGTLCAPDSAAGFVAQLLAHHDRVQKAKAPGGKRPWIDTFSDGRVAIRPGYTVDAFEPSPDQYVHAYRTVPIWSFACALGIVTVGDN